MAAITTSSDFRAKEEEICHCLHILPLYLLWSEGLDVMILVIIIIFLNIEL